MKKKNNKTNYLYIALFFTLLFSSCKSTNRSFEIVFYLDCNDEEVQHDMMYYSDSIREIQTDHTLTVTNIRDKNRCELEIWGDTLIYSKDGVVTDIDILEIINNYIADGNK